MRREVRQIAEAWCREGAKAGSDQPAEKVYWAMATLAEAALGLGDEQGASAGWMLRKA